MASTISAKKGKIGADFMKKTAQHLMGGTIDYFKDVMPTSTSVLSEATSTVKDVRSKFAHTQSAILPRLRALNLQTGLRKISNWYMQKDMEFADFDVDMGLDFDNDNVDNTQIAQSTINDSQRNANQISRTVVQSSHKMVEAQLSTTANILTSMDRQTAVISSGFDQTNSTLNKILEVMSKNTSAILEATVAASKSPISDGKLNLNEYKNMIKKNFEGSSAGLALSMFKMMSGMGGMVQPQDVVKMGMDFMMGKAKGGQIQKNLKALDSAVNDVLISSLIRLGEDKGKGGLRGMFAEVFGIDSKRKDVSTDRSSLELKSIPFDTVTKEAITTAIPGYLREILIALGGPDKVFDYRSKKFTTKQALRKEYQAAVSQSGSLFKLQESTRKKLGDDELSHMVYDLMLNELGVDKRQLQKFGNKKQTSDWLKGDILKGISGIDTKQVSNEFAKRLAKLNELEMRELEAQIGRYNVNRNQRAQNYLTDAESKSVYHDFFEDSKSEDRKGIIKKHGYREKQSNLSQSQDNFESGVNYTNKVLFDIYRRLNKGLNVYQVGSDTSRRNPFKGMKHLKPPKGYRPESLQDESRSLIDEKQRTLDPQAHEEGATTGDKVKNHGKNLGKAIISGNEANVKAAVASIAGDIGGFAKDKLIDGFKKLNMSFGNVGGYVKNKLFGTKYFDPITGKYEEDKNGGIFGKFKTGAKKGFSDIVKMFKGEKLDGTPDEQNKRKRILGSAVGAFVGMGLLGGPIGLLVGGLAGSSLSVSGIGGKIRKFIMGDEDKNKKGLLGGITGKLKKLLGYDKPDMTVGEKAQRKRTQLFGALGGLFAGAQMGLVGGPIGMIVAGLAGAAISTSGIGPKIVDKLLGAKGSDGKRRGGFLHGTLAPIGDALKGLGKIILTPFKIIGKTAKLAGKAVVEVALKPLKNLGGMVTGVLFGGKKPKLDDQGKPVMDKDGNPIYEKSTGLFPMLADTFIKTPLKYIGGALKGVTRSITQKIFDPISDMFWVAKQKLTGGRTISSLIFGEFDEDGNPVEGKGGLLTPITAPLQKGSKWLKDKVKTIFGKVFDAISNTAKSIITAPFKLMGMLLGYDPETGAADINEDKVKSKDADIQKGLEARQNARRLKRDRRGFYGQPDSSSDTIIGKDGQIIKLSPEAMAKKQSREQSKITGEDKLANKKAGQYATKLHTEPEQAAADTAENTADIADASEKQLQISEEMLNISKSGKSHSSRDSGTHSRLDTLIDIIKGKSSGGGNQSSITGDSPIKTSKSDDKQRSSDDQAMASVITNMTDGTPDTETVNKADALMQSKGTLRERMKKLLQFKKNKGDNEEDDEKGSPLGRLFSKLFGVLGPIGSLAKFGMKNPLIAGIATILGVSEGRSLMNRIAGRDDGESLWDAMKCWWENDSAIGKGVSALKSALAFKASLVVPVVNMASRFVRMIPGLNPPRIDSSSPFAGLQAAVLGGLYFKVAQLGSSVYQKAKQKASQLLQKKDSVRDTLWQPKVLAAIAKAGVASRAGNLTNLAGGKKAKVSRGVARVAGGVAAAGGAMAIGSLVNRAGNAIVGEENWNDSAGNNAGVAAVFGTNIGGALQRAGRGMSSVMQAGKQQGKGLLTRLREGGKAARTGFTRGMNQAAQAASSKTATAGNALQRGLKFLKKLPLIGLIVSGLMNFMRADQIFEEDNDGESANARQRFSAALGGIVQGGASIAATKVAIKAALKIGIKFGKVGAILGAPILGVGGIIGAAIGILVGIILGLVIGDRITKWIDGLLSRFTGRRNRNNNEEAAYGYGSGYGIRGYGGFLNRARDAISSGASRAWGAVSGTARNIGSTIASGARSVGNWFSNTRVGQFVGTLANRLSNFFSRLIRNLVSRIPPLNRILPVIEQYDLEYATEADCERMLEEISEAMDGTSPDEYPDGDPGGIYEMSDEELMECFGGGYGTGSSLESRLRSIGGRFAQAHIDGFRNIRDGVRGLGARIAGMNPFYQGSYGSEEAMRDAGCGPIAASFLANRLGININPKQAAKMMAKFRKKDGATHFSGIEAFGQKLGMPLRTVGGAAARGLGSAPAILLGRSGRKGSLFNRGGHYVVADGMDASGKVRIMDPMDPGGMKLYNYRDIAPEIESITGFGRGEDDYPESSIRRLGARIARRRSRDEEEEIEKMPSNIGKMVSLLALIGGVDPKKAKSLSSSAFQGLVSKTASIVNKEGGRQGFLGRGKQMLGNFGATASSLGQSIMGGFNTAREGVGNFLTNVGEYLPGVLGTAASAVGNWIKPNQQQSDEEKLEALRAAGLEPRIGDGPTSPFIGKTGVKITSPYGMRQFDGRDKFHSGVDMIPEGGSGQVGSVVPGIVTRVEKNIPGFRKESYGNYVEYMDQSGNRYMNAHLAPGSIPGNVQPGSRLMPGYPIGRMGSTGHSYGPHLHFQVSNPYTRMDPRGKRSLNPLSVLGRRGKFIPRSRRIGAGSMSAIELLNSAEVGRIITGNGPWDVLDLTTGISYQIRFGGGGGKVHRDNTPQTARDTASIFRANENQWSWTARPVCVRMNGRYIAAGQTHFPHGSYVAGGGEASGLPNNSNTPATSGGRQNPPPPVPGTSSSGWGLGGHFCLYFMDSSGGAGRGPNTRVSDASNNAALNVTQSGGAARAAAHEAHALGRSLSTAAIDQMIQKGMHVSGEFNWQSGVSGEMGNPMMIGGVPGGGAAMGAIQAQGPLGEAFAIVQNAGTNLLNEMTGGLFATAGGGAGPMGMSGMPGGVDVGFTPGAPFQMGADNLETVWNYFRSRQFGKAATAGIIGNLQQEAGVNIDPGKKQSGGGPGRGIAQWEVPPFGGRFTNLENFAQQRGTQWNDLKTQLEFMMYELAGGRLANDFNMRFRGENRPYANFMDNLNRKGATPVDGLAGFKKETNLENATRIFDAVYHRSGVPRMERRLELANAAFQRFANQSTIAEPIGTGPPMEDLIAEDKLYKSGELSQNLYSPLKPYLTNRKINANPELDPFNKNIGDGPAYSFKLPSASSNSYNGFNPLIGNTNLENVEYLLQAVLYQLQLISGNTGKSSDLLELLESKDFGGISDIKDAFKMVSQASSKRKQTMMPYNHNNVRTISSIIKPT